MPKLLTKKALVYCIRSEHLLVFRHVDFSSEEVGLQVPGGGVRAAESVQDAARRELCEETGYDCFEIESVLGVARYDISPYREEIQERHFVRATPTGPLPDRWRSQENHDGERAPTRLECFWLPVRAAHVLQSGQGAMLWRLAESD